MVHETIDGISIGFQIGEYEIVNQDNVSIRVIKSIKELPEVSIVTYPADDAARIDLTSVKSSLDNVKTIRDLEEFLRDACGFSKNLATATASRCKSVFTQGEPEVANEMPNDLKRMIALNLLSSRSL